MFSATLTGKHSINYFPIITPISKPIEIFRGEDIKNGIERLLRALAVALGLEFLKGMAMRQMQLFFENGSIFATLIQVDKEVIRFSNMPQKEE